MPDVYAACKRFDELGVEFVKKPDDGKMKGLAFIKVQNPLQTALTSELHDVHIRTSICEESVMVCISPADYGDLPCCINGMQ